MEGKALALLDTDLSVEQGSDWNLSWVWASPDPSGEGNLANAAYYNLTGCGARMQVHETEAADSTLLAAYTLGSGIALASLQLMGGPAVPSYPNGFTVTIPKADSIAMPEGEYYYDLFIDWTDGTSTAFLKGIFIVTPTGTR